MNGYTIWYIMNNMNANKYVYIFLYEYIYIQDI